MAIIGTHRNSNQKQSRTHQDFLKVICSWSLSDILNTNLYKFQVEEVPLTFSSTSHYMNSFTYLLLEETRADLCSHLTGISQAPVTSIFCLERISQGRSQKQLLLYRMTLYGTNYEPRTGDLIALTQVKPKCIDDLAPSNTFFLPAYVTSCPSDDGTLTIQMCSANVNEATKGHFAVYLTNLTTNVRIWQALSNPKANMNVIQTTFLLTSAGKDFDKCGSIEVEQGFIALKIRQAFDSFKLDSSQKAAVLSCLAAKNCYHENSSTKLIWGPPGTGKTKTVASLLFVLLRMKHKTLTCATTNVAVVGVAKRLLSLLTDHDLGCDTYGLGDMVLFGNEERMNLVVDHKELLDVFLDNRILVLGSCLSQWKTYSREMIRLLANPMKQYQYFLRSIETNIKREHDEINQPTFEQFAMNKFSNLGKNLIYCLKNLYTHLPTSVIPLSYAKKMNHATDLIQKVVESVKEIVTRNHNLKEAFGKRVKKSHFYKLRLYKTECLQALSDLGAASFIPEPMKLAKLRKLCMMNACLFFCTASSSIKLCSEEMDPIKMVLIDEAAQLKECESIIPLHISGVQKAVLIGDERQLPSMVQSKVCVDAKFGRSLFERLVLLGHQKHLLNVQYRMHPSISRFPNAEFYNGQIFNAISVTDKAREKCFLQGDMYGSYSFINMGYANEELDKNNSTRNMVEVAVIADIVANLFKESIMKKQTVSVGCISPYKAQVDAIHAKLGKKYNREADGWSFCVNIRSVDGFQGSEEDVIIFSTVRCNDRGAVGFLSSRERANVALTRARHCLWIVGNKETMVKSGSVWTTLVHDAENRGCLFDACQDKNLSQVMVDAMIELANFVSLLKTNSILFKDAKWKVIFANKFLERTASIKNLTVRKQVVSLLMKLSNGWRQGMTNRRNMLEMYKVDGHLQLVWSVDIMYEKSVCVQVLKFWDLVGLSQMEHVKHLERSAFGRYTYRDRIIRCQTKRIERNLVLPVTWHADLAHDPDLVLANQLAKLSLESQGGGAC